MSMQRFTSWSLRVVIAMLWCLAVRPAIAQFSYTVAPSPQAELLRPIWTLSDASGNQIGPQAGSVGDIDDDGCDDVAVYHQASREWRIYRGDPDSMSTEPAAVFRNGDNHLPDLVTGRFWGDTRRAIAMGRVKTAPVNQGSSSAFTEWSFYEIVNRRIRLLSSASIETRIESGGTHLIPSAAAAADIDNDGADELILYGLTRGQRGSHAEVWIYRGGPGFPGDGPEIILRDSLTRSSSYYRRMFLGKWDDDDRLDLLIVGDVGAGFNAILRFWFTTTQPVWEWDAPHRIAGMDNTYVTVCDCDGDAKLDLVFSPYTDAYTIRLYLSSIGGDIRTRTLTSWSADKLLHRPAYFKPVNLGYLNDSDREFEMIGIAGDGPLLGFSGGRKGPDNLYDVSTGTINHETERFVPIGDVNRDGWNDLMTIDYAIIRGGSVTIYAGGPYIPRDPLSVPEDRDDDTDNDSVTTWPNHPHDELHIVWRGDVSQVPERFQIYDVLGRRVAQGEVDPEQREALWRCDGAPSGVYFIYLYNWDGELVATARTMKR